MPLATPIRHCVRVGDVVCKVLLVSAPGAMGLVFMLLVSLVDLGLACDPLASNFSRYEQGTSEFPARCRPMGPNAYVRNNRLKRCFHSFPLREMRTIEERLHLGG